MDGWTSFRDRRWEWHSVPRFHIEEFAIFWIDDIKLQDCLDQIGYLKCAMERHPLRT